MIFKINKIFLEVAVISLMIGAVSYFGFQFYQANNQLASLQEQLNPFLGESIDEPIEGTIIEPTIQATSTATSTVSAVATSTVSAVPEEPKPDPCSLLNCNAQDGWADSGSTFVCQNSSNQTCACQVQSYFNYSCSSLKQKCVYSITQTRTDKYDCVNPAPPASSAPQEETPAPQEETSTPLPDLIIDSLDISPAPLLSGQLVSFSATVKNQGKVSARPSPVVPGLDFGNNETWDQYPGAVQTKAIAVDGNETIFWRNIWTSISGTHKIEVCADADSDPALRISESNETNNCLSRIFTVP